jgi:RNA polymerase sigma-70 factor (ECF subfamily)
MTDSSDDRAVVFEAHRPVLESLAYRMLGTAGDVDDVVQETYLRFRNAPEPESARAWLMTACTRICIDHLKSARVRREEYVGPWLPEPLLGESRSPEEKLELDQTLSLALFVLLEQLSPSERAAFLLHEVFDYSFDEIATILDRSAVACRKLASRARAHVRAEEPRVEIGADEWQALTDVFFRAISTGDLAGLESMLAKDATLRADGGGKATAAREVLLGREVVAKFLIGAITKTAPQARSVWFNGAPGLVLLLDGEPVSAIQLGVSGREITSVNVVRNPDKLKVFRAS